MEKIIQDWGRSGAGVYLTKTDMKIHNLQVGDIIFIEIKKIIREEQSNA